MNLDDLFHVFIDAFILCSTRLCGTLNISADLLNGVVCHQGYEAAADANQRIPLQCCVEGQPMAPTRCPFDEDGQCSAETGRLDRCLMARFFFEKVVQLAEW